MAIQGFELAFPKRSFLVSYKQTILGPLWLIINPLLTSLIYVVLFGNIAKLGTDGIPQMLFYLGGTALWSYFSSCLTGNSTTFTGNAHLFGKVYFPRLVMPVSHVIGSVIRFGIQMIPVAILLVYYLITGGVHPHYELWILFPFLLLWLGLLGMGFGILEADGVDAHGGVGVDVLADVVGLGQEHVDLLVVSGIGLVEQGLVQLLLVDAAVAGVDDPVDGHALGHGGPDGGAGLGHLGEGPHAVGDALPLQQLHPQIRALQVPGEAAVGRRDAVLGDEDGQALDAGLRHRGCQQRRRQQENHSFFRLYPPMRSAFAVLAARCKNR